MPEIEINTKGGNEKKSSDKHLEEQKELLTRILCDVRPEIRADGAYLFGQTLDNQNSVFRTAQELLKQLLTTKILISDSQPKGGYPGCQAWRHALNQYGIEDHLMEEVRCEAADSLNTLIEAEALIRHAKKMQYQRIFVVAAPFHQERAFITTVSVVTREYPDLKVYSYPGKSLAWQEEVVHSQGTVTATRTQLIHSEQERILKYHRKGDLISIKEVLDYLNRRG